MRAALLFTVHFTVLVCFVRLADGETPQLQVSIDFPGGSGKLVELDQSARTIHLVPTPHKDRGWDCWWYVQISGIRKGEIITLKVGEAPWATPDRASFSADNSTWTLTQPGKRERNHITYRQKVDADVCWLAWGPPFVAANAKELVDETARKHNFAEAIEFCRTREGRPVPALIIKEANDKIADKDRFGIWVQARQHAWEAGSSWVCQGFVEWIVSDDDRAVALRKTSTITIIPIMDVDNVEIGAGGKNQSPHDHNRDWGDEPHHNSVRTAMARIRELHTNARFDIFIDLHNPGAGSKNPFFYITPRDLLTQLGRRNLDRFLAGAQLEMTGPLTFQGETQESGANYDKQWRHISKNWVTLNTGDHVVSVTLETAWNTPQSTQSGYRTLGWQLGHSIERYFRVAQVAAE